MFSLTQIDALLNTVYCLLVEKNSLKVIQKVMKPVLHAEKDSMTFLRLNWDFS